MYGWTGNQTWDPCITSHVLYRLSYPGRYISMAQTITYYIHVYITCKSLHLIHVNCQFSTLIKFGIAKFKWWLNHYHYYADIKIPWSAMGWWSYTRKYHLDGWKKNRSNKYTCIPAKPKFNYISWLANHFLTSKSNIKLKCPTAWPIF